MVLKELKLFQQTSKSQMPEPYSIHTILQDKNNNNKKNLRIAGISSGQTSCFFYWSSNYSSMALCTVMTTSVWSVFWSLLAVSQWSQNGQQAASAAAAPLAFSDKPLLVLRPHYGDKENHRFMGSFWTTTSMYGKKRISVLLTAVMNQFLSNALCCGYFLELKHARQVSIKQD